MAAERASVHRVLVVLDTASEAAHLLEAASALAAGMRTSLAALFVEDERLMQAAALPFASELGVASAQVRPLAPIAIERALRAQAAQMRRVLEAAASRFSLSWSLEIERGRTLPVALARRCSTELLVFGASGMAAAARARVREPSVASSVQARTFGAVYDGTPKGDRALAAACAAAAAAGASLVAFVVANGQRADGEALQRYSEGSGVAIKRIDIPGGDVDAIAGATRGAGVDVLFVPGADGGELRVGALLAVVSCPLVLVP